MANFLQGQCLLGVKLPVSAISDLDDEKKYTFKSVNLRDYLLLLHNCLGLLFQT